MMKKLYLYFFILIPLIASPCWADEYPDIQSIEERIDGKLYLGFGLARDLISHAYNQKPFAPRDYDFAIINSQWSEAEAKEKLQQFGTVVRKADMIIESISPSGRVFSHYFGFVYIVDANGTQLDFKFFNSLQEAHQRAALNVEKILIPADGRSMEGIIHDFSEIASQDRLPNRTEASDPYKGIESTINGKPKTINHAYRVANPFDYVFRTLMIIAKSGDGRFKSEKERKYLLETLRSIRFVSPKDKSIILRALNHKHTKRVAQLLREVGFFQHYPRWRWHEIFKQQIKSLESRSRSRLGNKNKVHSCSKVFKK